MDLRAAISRFLWPRTLLAVLLATSLSGLGSLGCWIAPRHEPPPFDSLKPYFQTQVVAHRGCHDQAPENTFAAAQACIDLGVPYIEVDVRTSADGVFYIIHDATVDRTTNGSGWVSRLSAAQLDRLDAGTWFQPRFSGEPVPRLEPFMRWVKGKAKVYIDFKSEHVSLLIDLIYRTGMEDDTFCWFSSSTQAREFRRAAPALALMRNAYSLNDVIDADETYNAQIIESELSWITAQMVEEARRRQLKIMLVAIDKDPRAYRQVLLWGADLVNLNHPTAFYAVQENFKKALEGE